MPTSQLCLYRALQFSMTFSSRILPRNLRPPLMQTEQRSKAWTRILRQICSSCWKSHLYRARYSTCKTAIFTAAKTFIFMPRARDRLKKEPKLRISSRSGKSSNSSTNHGPRSLRMLQPCFTRLCPFRRFAQLDNLMCFFDVVFVFLVHFFRTAYSWERRPELLISSREAKSCSNEMPSASPSPRRPLRS